MERLQAFKFELMPTGEQARKMRQFAGACRFVYNKALALQKENHAAGEKFVGYVPMAKHLTAWRNSIDTPWLKDSPVHTSQALSRISIAHSSTSSRSAPISRASNARA
jgi:putative transposase